MCMCEWEKTRIYKGRCVCRTEKPSVEPSFTTPALVLSAGMAIFHLRDLQGYS